MRKGADHRIFRIIGLAGAVTRYPVSNLFSAIFIYGHRFYMVSITRKVKAPIRYLVALTKVYVIICLRLLLPLGITII